jgi:mono/diheme cytochrome c family protein
MHFKGCRYANALFMLVVGATALVACQRSDKELANVDRSKAPENPPYTAVANDESIQTTTIVKAVLPEGEEVLDGQALFAANCSACHQLTGSGVPGAFPPLNKSPYVISDKTDRMAAIILYGLQGEIEVLGSTYNGVMAPLGGTLNDKKIAAIMTYIRSAWDNKAGPVTPDVVTGVRTKWGTRSMFKIEELGKES